MNFLEFARLWCLSVQDWLEHNGAELLHGASEGGRPKHSLWITLRSGDSEGDLVVWESGEAELTVALAGSSVVQEHHDLGGLDQLAMLLARLMGVVRSEQK